MCDLLGKFRLCTFAVLLSSSSGYHSFSVRCIFGKKEAFFLLRTGLSFFCFFSPRANACTYIPAREGGWLCAIAEQQYYAKGCCSSYSSTRHPSSSSFTASWWRRSEEDAGGRDSTINCNKNIRCRHFCRSNWTSNETLLGDQMTLLVSFFTFLEAHFPLRPSFHSSLSTAMLFPTAAPLDPLPPR